MNLKLAKPSSEGEPTQKDDRNPKGLRAHSSASDVNVQSINPQDLQTGNGNITGLDMAKTRRCDRRQKSRSNDFSTT